ncbi:TonB family protein [Geminocystis sp. CENA526]|uniref:TonB family protein n=1 Tax=Geminocystis sp. CENA526 TaxID=1355871 RepID=UPI003D6FB771
MVTTTSSKTLSLQANAGKVIKEINWPLLTSIAFHGVFFTVVFPHWQDKNNNTSNNLSNTPVVQLNAIEQTRLPSLTPNASFNWDSLNNLPSGDTSLPTIPLSALEIPSPPPMADFPMPVFDNNLLANLPAPPSLPPASNLPPINYSTNYDNFYLPTPSIPTPTQLPPPPPVNYNAIAALPPPSIDFNTPKEGNVIDITADPTQERTITPEESILRQQIFADSQVEISANPRDVINGRVDYTPVIRGENDEPLAFQRQNNLVAKLQKDTANTSDEEARRNYITWAKEVQNVTPKQLTLSGVYPKDACVGKLEGTAAYGVTVDSAGSVVNTQLIKSSGYPLFNDQALRQIRNHGFANETGANKAYHVYVNYSYNAGICPTLSVDSLRNNPSVNSNSNIPSPSTSTPSNNSNNTSNPPATVTIPKEEKESNVINIPQENVTPSQELEIESKPVAPKPTVVAPPVAPKPAEVKPEIPNPSASSPKTLEIETAPTPSPKTLEIDTSPTPSPAPPTPSPENSSESSEKDS